MIAATRPITFFGVDPSPSPQDFLQASLTYRAWGWASFPLGGGVSLKDAKKPKVRWTPWKRTRPRDDEIAGMFRYAGESVGGLAVVTGRVSGGLVVRDFDKPEAYHVWAEENPDLAADAPTSSTGRGFHVYARNRGPELYAKFSDGELIGDSLHYAVLPPSIHPTGRRYRWLNREPFRVEDLPLVTLSETGFIPRTNTQIDARERQEEGFQEEEKPNTSCVPLCTPSPGSSLLSSLPLPIREAVLRTIPHRMGQRHLSLFRLAQSLRDISPGVQAGGWADAVRAWWIEAYPVIGTKDWSVTWNDFADAWKRADLPMSATRPRLAVRNAAAVEGDVMGKVVEVARVLSAETGGSFFLAGRTLAAELDIPPRTAARWLKRAVEAGYLEVVHKGRPSPRERKATVFRLGPAIAPQSESCAA